MPAIKELEIKKVKRTEDIIVRVLALEQDNYIIGTDNSTYRISLSGGRGSQSKEHHACRGREGDFREH